MWPPPPRSPPGRPLPLRTSAPGRARSTRLVRCLTQRGAWPGQCISTYFLPHPWLPAPRPGPDLFKLELSQLCPPLRALHPPDMAFALEPRRMGSSAGRRRKMNTGASGWSAGTQLQAGKQIYSQFTSVVQSCPTLCSGMDCNTPGLPVHHQIPELAQTCFFTRIYLFIWLH